MAIMSARGIDKSKLSPMMSHYFQTKEKAPGCILFYRLGDFYEMFFDDAVTVSKLLGLTLTGKDCGLEDRAAMCGVPHAACDEYIKKLLKQGQKVAIAEQLEDPKLSKGLVDRDIIKIVTPGTVLDSSMLDDAQNNFLGSIYCTEREDEKGRKEEVISLSFCDVSTGAAFSGCFFGNTAETDLMNAVARFSPVEVLLNEKAGRLKKFMDFLKVQISADVSVLDDKYFDIDANKNEVLSQFQSENFENIGIDENSYEIYSLTAVFTYVAKTQKTASGRFIDVQGISKENTMSLDYNTIRNLELIETLRKKEKKGSLFGVLDKTCTSMGRRLLKTWIEEPLLSPARIMSRESAVEALINSDIALMELRDALSEVYDIERLMTRVMYKTATPRDLRSLCATSEKLPQIKAILESVTNSRMIDSLNDSISDLSEIKETLNSALNDEVPVNYTDGGVIRDGFNHDLDEARHIKETVDKKLSDIEIRERERTGIKPLRIGYTRVFGYYIEVTRSYYDKVPENYIRRQTLANSERFVTEELKNLESEVLGANERALALEGKLFLQLREFVANKVKILQKTAESLATLDVLASFAYVAINNNYVKPDLSADGSIVIKDGRHPVVESMLVNDVFVPNDTFIDTGEKRMTIITGPNMSGKSTYMRQVALITLMAQIGSFVPCASAKISVCDKIFTRIGASDDLASGQSTFMVEMQEVSNILKNATKDSLVILDEVGRGTSTEDGVAIATAVTNYLCQTKKLGCKTLFATHYHELISLEGKVPGVHNVSVAVKKSGDSIKFLRKVVQGGAMASYGLEVAKLAGLPKKVIDEAKNIIDNGKLEKLKAGAKEEDRSQISFKDIERNENIEILKRTNIDELSDTECRKMLHDLQETYR